MLRTSGEVIGTPSGIRFKILILKIILLVKQV